MPLSSVKQGARVRGRTYNCPDEVEGVIVDASTGGVPVHTNVFVRFDALVTRTDGIKTMEDWGDAVNFDEVV